MKKTVNIIFLVIIVACSSTEKSSSKLQDESNSETLIAEPYNNDDFTTKYFWNNDSSIYYWNFIDAANNKIENRLDTFTNKWFSYFMYNFKLENLSSEYKGSEKYRILWLRTFDNPITIEISNKDSNYSLSYKISSGAGGYEFGEIISDSTFIIQQKNWEKFKELISKSDFWNLQTENNETLGLDGSEIILEGHHKNGYHMVFRWGGQEIRECVNYLIELSKIEIPEDEYY